MLVKQVWGLSLRATRCFATQTQTQRLEYSEFGDPSKVLSLRQTTLGPSLADNELVVQSLMAPINPVDLNMIQGVYPIKPQLPAVGGNESVGRVVKIGAGVKQFDVSDLVIRIGAGQGTWTTYGIAKADQLYKIDQSFRDELPILATLAINPATAYRMLLDFAKLNRGDVVIQNGANSAVGQCVIQVARSLGFKTVNVIRDRPDLQSVSDHLTSLGADIVLTEEAVKGMDGKALFKDIPAPKLALNCVGGKSSMFLASFLASGGKMVTYGGMSRIPVQCPTAPFIFKDITLHGFWMSKWYKDNVERSHEMLQFLLGLVREGKLKAPLFERVDFLDGWRQALEVTASGSGKKQLLVFKTD